MTDETMDETAVDAPKPIVYGVASALSPMVRRIVAHNPGMMTGPGTNTYLVGIDEIAVIDPGPGDAEHLKKRTGAEILAFDGGEGKSKVRLDGTLGDESIIEATEFHLTALHTPGHASNHLCYLLNEERTLFTGDHIMQGSTVVIRPPDGDMAAYLASLERLKHIRPRLRAIAPGHGHLITDPMGVLDEYIEHRLARERQIVDALTARGTAIVTELVEDIYVDVPTELHRWARFSVWAHLRKLADEGRVKGDDLDGNWSPA